MNVALDPSLWPALIVQAASYLQFDWPWVLIFLPAPLLWRHFGRKKSSRMISADSRALAVPPSLSTALTAIAQQGRFKGLNQHWLDAMAWVALIIALAQPNLPGEVTVTPVSGRAMVIGIDLSGSMERQDFSLDGVTADRLQIVQRVAADFIAQRHGDRLGLVVFGKEAFSATPLTFDLASVANTLNGVGIGMTGRSTAIGDAIGLSLSMLRTDPASEKAIVLLSDGTNNAGSVEPEAAAQLAESLGVRVHTIALGSDQKAPGGYATDPSADLDEATLEAISENSGGRFFRARTAGELSSIYETIDTLESAEFDAPPTRPRKDLRHWPLTLALALMLLGVWRESRA